MTLSEVRELENRLVSAEKIFLGSGSYSHEMDRIWKELRSLLLKVAAQRVRLEIADEKSP